MRKTFRFLIIYVFLLVITRYTCAAQERPFIWVKANEREAILQKIETQTWANNIYVDFINQLNEKIKLHHNNPEKFLTGMPFDWDKSKAGKIPPFHKTYHIENGKHKNLDNATEKEMVHARKLIHYLQTGIDCGIAYFLTQDEKYAQCATDILYSFVKAANQSELSDWRGRGGWLFPDDGFREVREIGYKVPIIYDFVAEYINKGGKPFDLGKKAKTDFPIDEAQTVFRKYATITVHYGHTGSNHPILEAPSLVYNALAMDDKKEREKWLAYFLTENTENQDALNVMASIYKNEGDIWPETSQYLNAAGTILTRLMLIVNKYEPSLRLGEAYSNILFSLPALDYLVYPNNQIIRWGDGKRYGSPSYSSYEQAYLLGKMDGIEKVTSTFGALLSKAFEDGRYKRSGIEALLWYEESYDEGMDAVTLTRTDKVTHAGIFLQRNLSTTENPEDGLMCFVGGSHMVHGHAEGMNIELYGKGEVLGVDNGRGRYQQDIHENYSRIFAAHNTVIVNGNSRSDSGWVNLGINTVQLIAMEPMPRKEAISPYYSFSKTSFKDNKGEKAEAYQERILALIRTSETTGYYVDVFRSKSELQNEFHDYLYHNIADTLEFLEPAIKLKPTPNRFKENANLPWVQNKQYRHPGWHFFEDVFTSETNSKNIRARFTASQLSNKPVFMDLHIPGFENREYTSVKAPHTFQAPKNYENVPTPTLVIRKKGEAWNEPFVVVYEPFDKNTDNHSILSVEKLTQQGKYKGLKVICEINSKKLVQYIITPDKEGFIDNNIGIVFKGEFGIISTDESGKVINMYLGSGNELKYKKTSLVSPNTNAGAFVEFSEKNLKTFNKNNGVEFISNQ